METAVLSDTANLGGQSAYASQLQDVNHQEERKSEERKLCNYIVIREAKQLC